MFFVGHGFSRPETYPKIDVWLNHNLKEPVNGLLHTGADVPFINNGVCLSNKMRIEKPGKRVEIASLYLPDCKRGVAVWKETHVISRHHWL